MLIITSDWFKMCLHNMLFKSRAASVAHLFCLLYHFTRVMSENTKNVPYKIQESKVNEFNVSRTQLQSQRYLI